MALFRSDIQVSWRSETCQRYSFPPSLSYTINRQTSFPAETLLLNHFSSSLIMPPSTHDTNGYTAKVSIIPSNPGSKIREHILVPGDTAETLHPRICDIEDRKYGLCDTLHYYDQNHTPTISARDSDGKSISRSPSTKARTHAELWLHNQPIKVAPEETIACRTEDGSWNYLNQPSHSDKSVWIMPASLTVGGVDHRSRLCWHVGPSDTVECILYDQDGKIIRTEPLLPGTGCQFTCTSLINTGVPPPSAVAIFENMTSQMSIRGDSQGV